MVDGLFLWRVLMEIDVMFLVFHWFFVFFFIYCIKNVVSESYIKLRLSRMKGLLVYEIFLNDVVIWGILWVSFDI